MDVFLGFLCMFLLIAGPIILIRGARAKGKGLFSQLWAGALGLGGGFLASGILVSIFGEDIKKNAPPPTTQAVAVASPAKAAEPMTTTAAPVKAETGPFKQGSNKNLALAGSIDDLAEMRLSLVTIDTISGKRISKIELKNGIMSVTDIRHNYTVKDSLGSYSSQSDNCIGFIRGGDQLSGVEQYMICKASQNTSFSSINYESNAEHKFKVAEGDIYYRKSAEGAALGSETPLFLRLKAL